MRNPALPQPAGAALASSDPLPLVRTPVAVIVSRFPVVTETFILRELIEMERQGQPVVLVPLLRERPAVVHPDARPWVRRALYSPFLSPAIAAANLRWLRRRPDAYLRTLATIVRANAPSPGMLARSLLLFPKAAFLAERLAEGGVGHVHAHFATHPGMAAWVVRELAGIPYSLTVHAHDIFVRREMLDEKLAGARFVRCVSEFNRAFLAARHPRHADALTVVHVGVDAGAERAEAPPADPARLLCIAALKPYKGHAVLLDACDRLRRAGIAFTCDLVGDGPGRAEIAAKVARLGLGAHVHLLGARTQEEVAARIASAAVIVQPSVVAADGQMEGIPVALMEAMAARKPVVASALSGIPELVADGVSGLLVPPGDPAALADALGNLLADPARAAAMGEAGRRAVAQSFDLGTSVAEVLGAIDAHRPPAAGAWAAALRAAGVGAPAAGLRRVRASGDSTVAEVLLPAATRAGATREAVLKIHRPEGETRARQAARREYRTLAALATRVGGAGEDGVRFGVPRPLGLDDGHGAVLMSACAGEPLADRIRRLRWRSGAAQRALLRDLERTGAWLRVFQQRTRGEGIAPPLETVIRAAGADLGAAGLPGPLHARVATRLRSLLPQVASAGMASVGHHGDLWPGNVFVSDHAVDVVDFEGYRPGLPYEDAAYFAVQLHLYYAYPLLAARGRRAEDAFLQGYLGGGGLGRAAWALFRTAKALQVLARTRSVSEGALRGWRRRSALLRLLEAES